MTYNYYVLLIKTLSNSVLKLNSDSIVSKAWSENPDFSYEKEFHVREVAIMRVLE